jgi:hypothetical protein
MRNKTKQFFHQRAGRNHEALTENVNHLAELTGPARSQLTGQVHQVMKRNLPSHKTTEEATFL